MLFLSRKRQEVITIGDSITVTVLEIRGDKVRLGIEAPKNIPIHRQEIRDVIAENARQIVPDGTDKGTPQ